MAQRCCKHVNFFCLKQQLPTKTNNKPRKPKLFENSENKSQGKEKNEPRKNQILSHNLVVVNRPPPDARRFSPINCVQ